MTHRSKTSCVPLHDLGESTSGVRLANVHTVRTKRARKGDTFDALQAAWGGVASLPAGTPGTVELCKPVPVPCPQGEENCSAPFCDC